MVPLPPQITQAKFDAGIVRPRPPKAAIEAGETTQDSKPTGPDGSTSSTTEGSQRPDDGGDALEHGGEEGGITDVRGGGNVEDESDVEDDGEAQDGDIG